jgi:hypothetical protein
LYARQTLHDEAEMSKKKAAAAPFPFLDEAAKMLMQRIPDMNLHLVVDAESARNWVADVWAVQRGDDRKKAEEDRRKSKAVQSAAVHTENKRLRDEVDELKSQLKEEAAKRHRAEGAMLQVQQQAQNHVPPPQHQNVPQHYSQVGAVMHGTVMHFDDSRRGRGGRP